MFLSLSPTVGRRKEKTGREARNEKKRKDEYNRCKKKTQERLWGERMITNRTQAEE